MKLTCPHCRLPIDPADINVATDLAKCERCGEILKVSELAEEVDISKLLRPPTGSNIAFQPDSSGMGAFRIPKKGVTSGTVPPVIFATIWVGFIAFWTQGAAAGGGVFALFSVPFWLVGLGMWWGILTAITETQELTIGTEGLSVVKKSILSSKQLEIPYADIDSIEIQSIIPRNPVTAMRYMSQYSRMMSSTGNVAGIPLATIVHGATKTHFAENASDAEAEWLVKLLKAVRAMKARTSG